MKTLERILTVGILMALILKFNLVPGGDVLVLWTMLILACLYSFFGFLFFNQIKLRHAFKKASYENVTTPRVIIAFVTGLGLATIITGSLFKLLNFSGADEMLLVGLIETAIVFAISVTLLLRNNDTSSKYILWRAGVVGGMGVFLILTPGLSIVKFQYRNHPAYIEAYTNYLADPANEELHKKMELEHYRVRLTDEQFKMYEQYGIDKTSD